MTVGELINQLQALVLQGKLGLGYPVRIAGCDCDGNAKSVYVDTGTFGIQIPDDENGWDDKSYTGPHAFIERQ